jgi:hypothetical protein
MHIVERPSSLQKYYFLKVSSALVSHFISCSFNNKKPAEIVQQIFLTLDKRKPVR